MLATAISKLKNLRAIKLDDSLESHETSMHWGARDLMVFAGVKWNIPDAERDLPGRADVTTLQTHKLMRAINVAGHAERPSKLVELHVSAPKQHFRNVPMGLEPHRMGINGNLDAFVRHQLTHLSLNIHAYARDGEDLVGKGIQFGTWLNDMLGWNLKELRIRFTGDYDLQKRPRSLGSVVWETLAGKMLPYLSRLEISGKIANTMPSNIVPAISMQRSTLEELVLGPLDTGDDEDRYLPCADVFNAANQCTLLHSISFGLNATWFEWASEQETKACLNRMTTGGTIEDEEEIWDDSESSTPDMRLVPGG